MCVDPTLVAAEGTQRFIAGLIQLGALSGADAGCERVEALGEEGIRASNFLRCHEAEFSYWFCEIVFALRENAPARAHACRGGLGAQHVIGELFGQQPEDAVRTFFFVNS